MTTAYVEPHPATAKTTHMIGPLFHIAANAEEE